MAVTVTVEVEIKGSAPLSLSVPVVEGNGDNPLYYASQVRAALLKAAGRLDDIITGEFGDISAPRGPYTPRLVAGPQ